MTDEGSERQAEGRYAFLFADLAGYTALTESHGDAFAADAAADFYERVRRLLTRYGAEEVKCIGDSVRIRVDDAAAAVKLGAEIIEDSGHRHGALAVRVGAHTGPAVERDGDWFGAVVNLAARVAVVAEPGEVLMTDDTLLDTGNEALGLAVQPRGRRRFKNVVEPVAVHALVLSARPGSEQLPVDPVCQMAVDPDQAEGPRNYHGVEYHFCSTECAQVFDRSPDSYTRPR